MKVFVYKQSKEHEKNIPNYVFNISHNIDTRP